MPTFYVTTAVVLLHVFWRQLAVASTTVPVTASAVYSSSPQSTEDNETRDARRETA